MPRQHLSDMTVRTAEPPVSGSVTLWDTSVRNFGLRITSTGARSFIILIGSGRRQVIGRWPTISLAQARSKAKQIFAERTLGRYQPRTIAWEAARGEFLSHAKAKNRPTTFAEYERILNRYFPFTGALHDITKDDVAQRLARICASSQRDHALVCLRVFFRWAVSRGHLNADPTAGLQRTKLPPRARLLTDDEIRSIWRACNHVEDRRPDDVSLSPIGDRIPRSPAAFPTIVKLLILTGQRRNEIASLRAEFIKDGVCTLPSALTKNKREHAIPLGACAVSILSSHASKAGLLFPARGSREAPFNGWSKSKAALDRQLAGTVDPWTLHDLRRYYASTMARLGVKQEVTERLLNHRSGIISGISAVYTLHDFQPEMRAAIEKYDRFLHSKGVTG
jgi:integrase